MPHHLANTLDLPTPDAVLGLLGSLWTDYYGGSAPLAAMAQANLELVRQQHQNLHEVVACVSRLTVPLYHTERWTLLELSREDQSGLSFPKPEGLVGLPLLSNRMTAATCVLHEGIDYTVSDIAITFEEDPFSDPRIPQMGDTVFLWGFGGQFDREYVYKHFGYILGLKGETSQRYKDTINAIMDCNVQGTTIASLEALLAAILDVPVADGLETVLSDATDRRGRFLATTRNIYRIAQDAILGPPEGSQPRAGTPLVEAFKISEFRANALPAGVTEVFVPAGMGGDLSVPVPVGDLTMNSAILIQTDMTKITDTEVGLISRVLPPQTGVVFAAL